TQRAARGAGIPDLLSGQENRHGHPGADRCGAESEGMMADFDWIKEFGEPGPHVSESAVPILAVQAGASIDATVRRAKARALLTPVCESPIEIDLGAAILDLAKDGEFIL